MKTFLLTLPIAILFLSAPTAIADEAINSKKDIKIKKVVKNIVDKFTKLDVNGDGKVVIKEYEARAQKNDFATRDTNNDGVLSIGEMVGVRKGHLKDDDKHKTKGLKKALDKAKNKDKRLKTILDKANKRVRAKVKGSHTRDKDSVGGYVKGKNNGSSRVGRSNKGGSGKAGGNKGGGGKGGRGGKSHK